MAGLPVFEPLNQTQPFTYRDTATNLTILRSLRDTLNALIDAFNASNDTNTAEHNRIVHDLTEQFNNALVQLRSDLEADIADLQLDAASANDPTTGVRSVNLTRVISNVYDNARVFAYFAKEDDDLNITAAQRDARNLSARHIDLGITYPVIHDALS